MLGGAMVMQMLVWTLTAAIFLPPCILAQWQQWARLEGADVSRFYASTSGVLYVQLSSGMKIFRSFDGGISWNELILPRSKSNSLFTPCADSLGLEALLFITDHTWYRSRDHGFSWQEIPMPDGLPATEEILTIVAGRYGQILIATRSTAGVNLYLSRDQGSSISLLGEIPAGRWQFYQAHDSAFYCYGNGLYRIDWQRRTIVQRSNESYQRFYSSQEHSGAPATMWAVRGSAVFRSTDGGNQWSDASIGLPPLDTHALLVAGREGTMFCLVRITSDSTAIYRRFAAASGWSLVSRQRFVANDVIATLSGTLLVATPHGVFSSEESGFFWSNSSSGIQGIGVSCAAFDPTVALIATTTSGEIFRSLNAGLSWASSATLPEGTVVTDAYIRAPNTVLLATTSGLWCSADGGTRFTQCSTASGAINQSISSLAWLGGMFIATSTEIAYVSADAMLWTAVPLPLQSQERIVRLRTNDSVAIIATTHSILAVEQLLPPTVRTIATLRATILDCDIASDGSIGLVADSNNALYYRRYRSNGAMEVTIPLPTIGFRSLALSHGGRAFIAVTNDTATLYTIGRIDRQATPDTTISEPVLYMRRQSNGELLATTAYGAIYRMAKDSILSTAAQASHRFVLVPNPASEELRIIAATEGIERICIYDLQGRKVLEHLCPAFPTDVVVKLHALQPGYYTVYVQTLSATTVKPIIIGR